ncbi:hypothetical protein [Pseudonocardia sp. 73-21]|uniref:hypothetical protein n=1 Tax=Pseudonocardia sp. 73-21 TaxID=1895809 RepID=UPI00095E3942|nr:hypothetical protein [Pseudonocardia sp. 73-21]OJY51946.1 MAG: hypothetical protein BGP03_22875 [Pseudonocardia sp. 73-21]
MAPGSLNEVTARASTGSGQADPDGSASGTPPADDGSAEPTSCVVDVLELACEGVSCWTGAWSGVNQMVDGVGAGLPRRVSGRPEFAGLRRVRVGAVG